MTCRLSKTIQLPYCLVVLNPCSAKYNFSAVEKKPVNGKEKPDGIIRGSV